jgi:exonuclease III
MAEMSVVSLNVNGLRDYRKRRLLFDFIKYEKFDVIFLQETHIATVEDCVRKKDLPFGFYPIYTFNNIIIIYIH